MPRRATAALAGAALAAGTALGWAAPARAHTFDVASAEFRIEASEVRARVEVNLFELDLQLSLDRDANARVDDAEIAAGREKIGGYLAKHVVVRGADTPAAPMRVLDLRKVRDAGGRERLRATLAFAIPGASGIEIRCDPLAELGPNHRTVATILLDGRRVEFLFEEGAVFRAREARAAETFTRFFRAGTGHILEGYDHLLFLFGLLLAIDGLFAAIKVATAFTLSHSVTLGLAALDLLSPPTRWVEAAIAASIAYVAIENLAGASTKRRWLLALLFGLVHGFGFASALRASGLERQGLLVSLLSFNLGVETGQIAVIAAVLPLLALIRGRPWYQRAAQLASAAILLQALVWFWQRLAA